MKEFIKKMITDPHYQRNVQYVRRAASGYPGRKVEYRLVELDQKIQSC